MIVINDQFETPNWQTCPRCGSASLETLRTHSHCIDCNYSPTCEIEEPIPAWVYEQLKAAPPQKIREVERVFTNVPMQLAV